MSRLHPRGRVEEGPRKGWEKAVCRYLGLNAFLSTRNRAGAAALRAPLHSIGNSAVCRGRVVRERIDWRQGGPSRQLRLKTHLTTRRCDPRLRGRCSRPHDDEFCAFTSAKFIDRLRSPRKLLARKSRRSRKRRKGNSHTRIHTHTHTHTETRARFGRSYRSAVIACYVNAARSIRRE